MEDSTMSENTQMIITCGHCKICLGTMQDILDQEIPSKHVCYTKYENITVNFETYQMYGINPNIQIQINPNSDSDNSMPLEENEVSQPGPSHLISPNVLTETHQWTDNSILSLIHAYVEHKEKFMSPLYNKKRVWEIISQTLEKQGVYKTATKCDEKWRNLKKTYDKVVQEKNKSGNSQITWKFFHEFHEIYFKDPRFHPIATASSSGICKSKSNTVSEDDDSSDHTFSPGERKRKRSVTAIEIDKRKQKRHEERLKLKCEMFEWFKENYGKKNMK